jgi:hypothetical protein
VATHFTHLVPGKLESGHPRLAVLYRFDHAGDGIPEHAHGPDMTHDVRCTRGSVMVYGPTMVWCHLLKAGDRLEFDSQQPHEIQALEEHSSVVNEYYRGIPSNYGAVLEADKDGVVTLPLKLQLATGVI